MNKLRLAGLFTLDEKGYYQIGELLYFILDEIITEKDYESAKNLMNLSQTLYKTASEPNKPRIFLQVTIENHPIWKNMDFWEELIKCTFIFIMLDIINEEMHNQKNYNIYTFESPDDKSGRIKNIVVTQLISFTYNMLSFGVSKGHIKDLILNFSKYYDLDDIKVEEIFKNLEDYSLIYDNKNKSQDNIQSIEKEGDFSVVSTNCKISSDAIGDNSDEENK